MERRVKRHGRRPIRSSLTGPSLPDPDSRVLRFEIDARAAIELLRQLLPDELRGLKVGFSTAPPAKAPPGQNDSGLPLFYSVDRRHRSIVLYRMPIQRAQVLHVDDAEHRRLFIGHCVYRAVCEYLGQDPWDLLPGRFDHY
jgi:hypothetical protein